MIMANFIIESNLHFTLKMLDVVELVEISIGVTSSLLTMDIIGGINELLRLLVPVCIAANKRVKTNYFKNIISKQ